MLLDIIATVYDSIMKNVDYISCKNKVNIICFEKYKILCHFRFSSTFLDDDKFVFHHLHDPLRY